MSFQTTNTSPFGPISRPPMIPNQFCPNWSMSSMPMFNPMMWPRMWSPSDNPYYPYPQSDEAIDPFETEHSANCCLSGKTCSLEDEKTFEDFGHNSRYEEKECSAQTATDESTDEEGDLSTKLMDTKMDVLDVWYRLAVRQIDSHNHCLEVMAEYVDVELKRFEHRQDISGRLKGLGFDIKRSLADTKDIKNRILNEIEAQKTKILEDVNTNYDLLAIDFELKPFPDLLYLYQTLLEQTVAETTEKTGKTCDKNCCDCKSVNKEIASNSNLKKMTEKWQEFAIDDPQEAQTEVDLFKKESNVGKTFGNDRFPVIELGFPRSEAKPKSYSIANPKLGHELEPIGPETAPKAKPNDEPLPKLRSDQDLDVVPDFKIPEPKAPKMNGSLVDRLPKSLPNFKSVHNIKPMSVNQPIQLLKVQSVEEPAMGSFKCSTRGRLSSATSTTSLYNDSLVFTTVRPQDKKIIIRLKEKYPLVSEEKLLDSMEQTREMLKSFNKKGFSGLRVLDVVDHVCRFIEANEIGHKPEPIIRNVCGICRGLVVTIIEKVILSCSHVFHTDCLKEWANTESNSHCPNCLNCNTSAN